MRWILLVTNLPAGCVDEVLQLGHLLVRFVGFHLVECLFAVFDCGHQLICGREGRVCDVLVEELD